MSAGALERSGRRTLCDGPPQKRLGLGPQRLAPGNERQRSERRQQEGVS